MILGPNLLIKEVKLNVILLTGRIKNNIKIKYKDKESELQKKPSYLYFDFIIEDGTKITAIISNISQMTEIKKNNVDNGAELFLEGKLDFQNEIKSHKLPFEYSDIMLQMKIYHPIIKVSKFRILSNGGLSINDGDIVSLADSIY